MSTAKSETGQSDPPPTLLLNNNHKPLSRVSSPPKDAPQRPIPPLLTSTSLVEESGFLNDLADMTLQDDGFPNNDDHNTEGISRLKRNRGRRTRSLYGVNPDFHLGPKARIMRDQEAILTIQDPGSQRLTWNKTPLSVLVIKKHLDYEILDPFKRLVIWLVKEKNMLVFIESKVLEEPLLVNDDNFQEITSRLKSFNEDQCCLTDKIDFIVCLGGDGTLLYASSLFQQSCPPVMAFHFGSLGFLTPHDFNDTFTTQVNQVLNGTNVGLTLRSRLKCVICKKDSECSKAPQIKNIESRKNLLVLNEVVIDRGPSPYICNIDLYIQGRHVTSVQGDGLIISTPSGSTAYAAAAGASMIHPNVPAILVSPICPHSLSFRPVVVPAGVEIKVMLAPSARNTAWVSFDGRNRQEIHHGDCVRITTSTYPVPCVCNQDQISDWFEGLAECLHWNVRKPQKAFSKTESSTSLVSLNSELNNFDQSDMDY